ncbi:MAG: hypothetical protein MUP14_03550 [Dehalococcoidia bacterium]|nr:hypothetical protein [Dehalococcoidia bacterium]
MSEVAVTEPDEVTTEPGCHHHWLIESPHGPTSMGICKLCGEQKEFRNSASDLLWEDEPLSELSYGRWGKSREFSAPAGVGADGDLATAGVAAGGTRLV